MTATVDRTDRTDETAKGAETEPALSPVRTPVTVALVICVVVGAVLRVIWARHYGMSFDEAFTAMAGRRSLGDMFSYLRDADAHPPLDYLLRDPLARAGASAFVFRAPSLVFSVGALALFAWWMRTRAVAGVVATALFALSGFAVAYGSEARMYALLQLLGVAAAMIAESWLRAPRRRHAVLIGVVVLVGCLDHTSMFLLGGALLVLAGWRRDRAAWEWRAGIVGAGTAWALLWGSIFLTQLRAQHSSWIPPTTARGVIDGVTSMVTFTDGVGILVAAAIAAGAVVLARGDRTRFRVWCICGALPIAAAAVIGLELPFFLNRTLMLMLWAPIVAVGAAVGAAWQRSRPIGLVLAALVLLITWPGTANLLQGTWEYDVSFQHLEAVARPGDVVAVVPSWYAPVAEWRVEVRKPLGSTTPVRVAGIPDAVSFRIDGAPVTGRIVLLEFGASRPDLHSFGRCAPVWTFSETRIRCLVPRRGS